MAERYTSSHSSDWMKYTTAKPVPPEWATLIDRYLANLAAAGHPATTIDTRRQHLHFMARRIELHPREVDSEALVNWCALQTWKPESRRGRTISFRLFWRWAAENDLLDDVAIKLPKVRSTPGVPRPTPDRVYMRAIMRSDIRTRLILRLAGEVGLRRGEIAQIHSDDIIDDMVGTSLLVHGKGGRERIVPLTEGIGLELSRLDYGFAFPGKQDGHLSPRRVGELAADALDEHWTLHTLRHRFATRTYQIDHDVFAVQELLGHASSETTRRYVQRGSERLRSLVERAAS